jgi:glycosyltransferase involved in cell wall biosynthesis
MSEHRDIWFVLPSLDTGGAERVTVNLSNGLADAGERPRILLTDSPGRLATSVSPRVPVVALGRPRVRQAIPALLRLIRADRPDVIIATHRHVSFMLCFLRPFLPRSVALIVREPSHPAESSDRAELRQQRWQRLLYPRADLVIATSATMQTDLQSRSPANVRTLVNPVDVGGVRRVGATWSERTDAGRWDTGRTFVAVGRLAPEKAYPDLFRAFARGARSGDTLRVFGDGPERPSLERLLETLGLSDRVSLEGVDPSVWARIATSDALILASTYEGMPNAALEALALGIPVIATTDLTVLAELEAATAPGAITLVDRERLDEALGEAPRSAARGSGELRPSLLPPQYSSAAVVQALRELLDELSTPLTGHHR